MNGIIMISLNEDVGPGDVTTEYIVPKELKTKALIRAKEKCIVCGLGIAETIFRVLDPKVIFHKKVKDGSAVSSDTTLAEIEGNARCILTGERTALNFMQRLSGIATFTHKLASKIGGNQVKLLDTRKTTPGLRMLEKYAVKCGGGTNHRNGLYDAILIKDNHIKLVGLESAIKKAKESGKIIEIEASTLEDVKKSVKGGADTIMLDNMPINDIREAVKIIEKKAVIEVSGNINESNIKEIAELGVDKISVGSLTHSVKAIDIAMYIVNDL